MKLTHFAAVFAALALTAVTGAYAQTPTGTTGPPLPPNDPYPTEPPDGAGADLAALNPTLRFDVHRGLLDIREVECPPVTYGAGYTYSYTCAGTLAISTASKVKTSHGRRKVDLGRMPFQLGQATSVRLAVPVSAANRKLIRRLGRVRVRVAIENATPAKNHGPQSRTVSVVLRHGRPERRAH